MKHLIFYSLMAVCTVVGISIAGEASATEQVQALPKVKGVVRAIDTASERIKLKHDDIPNLGMPGMTMVFYVSDPAMLQQVAVGDKVLFSAEEPGGNLTIVWIEKQ